MKTDKSVSETEQGRAGGKFGRRTFFQRIARGALVSFAGWMAARGTNVLWAKELAVKTGGKLKSSSRKPDQLARNDHTDTHDDSHMDTHMDNTSYHSDFEGPKAHIDSGGIHMDGHVDLGHTDNHSDDAGNAAV